MAESFNADHICHKSNTLVHGGSSPGGSGTGRLHSVLVGSTSDCYLYFAFSQSVTTGDVPNCWYPTFGWNVYVNYSSSPLYSGYCGANVSDWIAQARNNNAETKGPNNFWYFCCTANSAGYMVYIKDSGYPCQRVPWGGDVTNYTAANMKTTTHFKGGNQDNRFNLGNVAHVKVNITNHTPRNNGDSNRYLWVAKAGAPSSDYYYLQYRNGDSSQLFIGGNGSSSAPASGTLGFTHTFTFGGGPRIWNGSNWVQTVPYLWNGSSWKPCITYIWNGSSWAPIGK